MRIISFFPTTLEEWTIIAMISPITPPCRSTIPICQGDSIGAVRLLAPYRSTIIWKAVRKDVPRSHTMVLGGPAHSTHHSHSFSAHSVELGPSRTARIWNPVAKSTMFSASNFVPSAS